MRGGDPGTGASGGRGWLSRFALQALDASMNAIAFSNLESELTYVNRKFLELWGYADESEVLGRPAASFWRSALEVNEVVRQMREKGGWIGELVAITKGGEARVMELSSSMIFGDDGAPIGMMGSFVDVTARKSQEARLAVLTRLYVVLGQVNQTIVRTAERDVLIREVCRIVVDHGHFRAAWIGLRDTGSGAIAAAAAEGAPLDVLTACAMPASPAAWSIAVEAARSGSVTVLCDVAHDPRGEACGAALGALEVRSVAAVPLALLGELSGVLCLFDREPLPLTSEVRGTFEELGLDVAFALDAMRRRDEQRRAEALRHEAEVQAALEVRTSEERLQEAVRVADIGIFDHDHRTDRLYWSPELRRMLRCDPEAVPSKGRYLAFTHPDDRPAVAATIARAHEPDGDGRWDMEHRLLLPDGELRWVRARSQTYFGGEEAARVPVRTVGALRDITAEHRAAEEKERLRAQLAQAQKIESIGRLAGGIAHDFNNMLAVILGHTELALAELDPASGLRADLVEVQRAAERSAELTRQLLAFARRQPVQPKVVNLNHTVAAALKMLERLIGEDIALGWTPARDLWPVKVDPAQIDQVLANLATNSRDAITGVGRITITTKNTSVDAAYAERYPGAIPGEYVLLTFADDGCGMTPETAAKVFEPFFTTKKDGQGTGLGLATVAGIVEQHGGFVALDSVVGRGTTVSIHLPRSGEVSGRPARSVSSVEPKAPADAEVILLVEDEPQVLRLTKTLLTRMGYQVLAASSPSEALKLAEEHGSRLDLLLTDVIMPEMNGQQLHAAITARLPHLPSVFVSAHPESILSNRGVLEPNVHFLQKPFTGAELASAVRQALSTRAGR